MIDLRTLGRGASMVLSAVVAVFSLVAIARLPAQEIRSPTSGRQSRGPRLREITALLFNGRFMTLTGLAAMPAKVILTGVCFYLVPLYIVSIGNTSAMAGRMLMVYAVIMVLIVPLSASLSDASLRRDRYVSWGLIISGISGLLLLLSDNFLVLFGVVFLLGLGQALSIAARWAKAGHRNPGAISEVTAAPPGRSARSSTSGLMPAPASAAAATSALWPAPMITASRMVRRSDAFASS